uniref:DUF641 domain-containing protein n=1 Tax=Oryza glumipatula TaxID=40148 RepID=A0A0D9YVH8_9ORYZ
MPIRFRHVPTERGGSAGGESEDLSGGRGLKCDNCASRLSHAARRTPNWGGGWRGCSAESAPWRALSPAAASTTRVRDVEEGRCGATSCVSGGGEDGRAAATAHAFVAQHPYDAKEIQSADAAMVAELTKLSDHNWRFAKDPVDTAKSVVVGSAVLAEHADEQHNCRPEKK